MPAPAPRMADSNPQAAPAPLKILIRERRARLAAHFSKRHGVITRSEAKALGLNPNAIARRLASGEWEAVHPEVYRLAGAPKTPLQEALAASLWAGPGAVVSHESALRLWLKDDVGDVVNVSTTHRRNRRKSVALHRVRWISPRDITSCQGVPVTTPERTVMDLAGTMKPAVLAETVETLLHRALVTLKTLLKQVVSVRSRWVRGRSRLRQLVQKLIRQGGKGDRLADATGALLLRGGLDVPEHNHPVADAQGNLHSIPLAFPKEKVAFLPHDKDLPWCEKPSHRALGDMLCAAGWRLRLVEFRQLAKRFTLHTHWLRLIVANPEGRAIVESPVPAAAAQHRAEHAPKSSDVGAPPAVPTHAPGLGDAERKT